MPPVKLDENEHIFHTHQTKQAQTSQIRIQQEFQTYSATHCNRLAS